jgi:Uma2 family endonuclease
MSVAAANPRLTEAEYLEQERRAEFKSEFFDGEVFAMAGGTRAHSVIGSNLIRVLGNQLEARPCVIFNADLRVKIERTGLITYPDASVVCGPEEYLDQTKDTLLNPALVAEVLSESTEAYDRGTKFVNYRMIPSLGHILFVSQREPRVECYTRVEGQWRLSEAAGLDSDLDLGILGISLPLRQLFAHVNFDLVPKRLHP